MMQAMPGNAGPVDIDPARLQDWGVWTGGLEISLDASKQKYQFTRASQQARASQNPDQAAAEELSARWASPRERLTGPIQFVLKLLEFWRLERRDAVTLLGFGQADAAHVADVLDGLDHFRGRDVRDRIAHLFRIRESLDSLFRDLEVENQWLREPHSLLGGKPPLSMILGGSMEDLLLAREYVDSAAGR